MRPLLLALALLAAGLCARPAMAQNRFWLVNESGLTVQHAYISPSRLSDWGDDILGGTRLAPGEQVRVTPAAKDCVLDLKVEYEGGQEEEKMEVDACRLNRIVFTNPNGRAEGPDGRLRVAGQGSGDTIRRHGGQEASFAGHPGTAAWERHVASGRAALRGSRLRQEALADDARRGCATDIRLVTEEGRQRLRAAACARPEIALAMSRYMPPM